MKEKILKKLVKKDYNNKLEEILSKKDFSEEVKNTLLSIFYKIENGYQDYHKIKRETFDKKEYIEKLIDIIDKDCEKIEFITKNNDKQEKVDKDKKEIICLPIENKILYALAKIQKRQIVVKYIDEDIGKAFSFMLNTGNNINMVEPLRDFNGFSWNIIVKDIEDVNCNLMYQNIIYLVGNKFVDKWVNNYEPLVDYFELFQNEIEKKYGKKIKDNILDYLLKLSLKLKAKYDENFKETIKKKKEELEQENSELENREQYLGKIAKCKKEKEKQIKELDKIINSKKLLMEEYENRNKELPLEKKIFSIRVLKNNLKEERKTILNEIDVYNQEMIPKVFLEKKHIIEKKLKYFSSLEEGDLRKDLIDLQKEMIKCMSIDIQKEPDKNKLTRFIYQYRYYSFLPFDSDTYLYEVKELKRSFNKLTKTLIEQAINSKVIIKITDDEKLNFNMTQKILLSKIIILEDIFIKIANEKDWISLIIFDEEIEDSKIKLKSTTKEKLTIKMNKKNKLFI